MTTTRTDNEQALADWLAHATRDTAEALEDVNTALGCQPKQVDRAHLLRAQKALEDAASALRWVQP